MQSGRGKLKKWILEFETKDPSINPLMGWETSTDTLEEVKTICHCGKKASFNMMVQSGVAIKEGNPIVVDDDSLKQVDTEYKAVCRKHWKDGVYK